MSRDCVHCGLVEETTLHLLLYCDFASKVWKEVFQWIGVVIVIPPNKVNMSRDCVHCGLVEETTLHLFLYCDFASKVWEVFQWIGVVIVIPPNLFILFECLNGEAADKKFRKGFWLIWNTTLWVIWKHELTSFSPMEQYIRGKWLMRSKLCCGVGG